MRDCLITRNFFDDAFDNFFKPVHGTYDNMKTDIKELEDGYEMSIEMPGFDKNEVEIELDKGYLNISAKKEEKEEKEEDEKEKYISRERKVALSRSYYVGDVNEENIKAKYDNGILELNIPKKVEQANKILIE